MGKQQFYPSLEGIRGYAFLLVFVLHYAGTLTRPDNPLMYPFYWATQVCWFVVPLFFALSGFLITNIVFDSVSRKGYFRVFYLRRIIRVFPVYYVCMVGVALVMLLKHATFYPKMMLYLVYLQNFSVFLSLREPFQGKNLSLVHFWSLAVEEQFYLLWPVVVWLVRDRIKLLRFCYGAIAASFLLRLCWPLTHLEYGMAYHIFPARMDGILVGSAFALHRRAPGFNAMRWLVPGARIAIVAGIAVASLKLFLTGTAITVDYIGVAVLIPAENLIGFALVLLAIEPSTWTSRICSKHLICRVGRLSYGLYAFHEIYRFFFQNVVIPRLALSMGKLPAQIAGITLAFLLTLGLAEVSFRFVELPISRLKTRVRYGPLEPPSGGEPTSTATLAPESESVLPKPERVLQV